MRAYASVFLRGFLVVFTVSLNVRLIEAEAWAPMFGTGFLISWLWWVNARDAAWSTLRLGRLAYALGAAFGTVAGAAAGAAWA